MSLRPCAYTLASSFALALAAGPTAFAQDAPAASGALEEVTVTAQRREEKLQDVPIAITAFSGEQLAARGITNVGELSSLAPNVNITTATGNTTGFQISIRGGVQINPALYWDPTVGVYVDGVYIPKNLGSVFDIMDLERVEVLRGPQGTLYGRNTLAGAVSFVTRKPSGEYKGEVSTTIGNFGEKQIKGSFDLPKMGIVSLSFGARKEQRNGTVTTKPGSSVGELNNRDQEGARFAAKLDFSDSVTGLYRFDYSNADQLPLHSYLYRADLPFLTQFVTKNRDSTVAVDGPTFERSRVLGHAFTLTWDINDALQLKSITAKRILNWSDSLDLDGSPVAVAHTGRFSKFNSVSEELQLVGSADRVNFVTGLYYYKDDGTTNNPQQFFFGTFNFDSRYGYRTRAWAAFGQVDYKLTDSFTLTGGVRYTSEKKGINRQLGVNFAVGTPFIPLIPAGTTAEKTFTDTTPLVTLAYKFSPDVNVYLKYSEGFKSGGFNGEFGDVGFTPAVINNNIRETQTPFNPEKQKSVELGVKSTLLGGTLSLNAAVFQNKTTDLQLSIFQATGAASSVIRNAGKTTTKGIELEANWHPIDAVRLQGSYGYLDAKYDEFIDAGANVANNRAFVHAPKNSFNLLADVTVGRLAGGRLHALADYAWTDSMYLYPFQLSGPGQPGYNPNAAVAGATRTQAQGMLNVRFALSEIPVAAGTAEISLWSRNLTDEKKFTNAIDFGPGFGNLTPAYYPDPRTYGIEASIRW